MPGWLLTILLLASAPTSPEPPAQAREFVNRFTAVQQAGATPANVDRFLELCTDEVIYEHPRVGAVIRGKAEVRKGLVGHLGDTRSDRTRLVEWLQGPNVLTLRIERAFEARDGEAWKPVRRGSVFVLDLDASGRIRRILDFW
jgi:hypothetical protein